MGFFDDTVPWTEQQSYGCGVNTQEADDRGLAWPVTSGHHTALFHLQ